MRDPRFYWDTTRLYWIGQDKRAEEFIGTFGDVSQLELAVARWWSLEREQSGGRDDESRRSSAIRLQHACEGIEPRLAPLVGRLANAVIRANDDDAGTRAASRILGRALGRAVAVDVPNARTYDRAVQVLAGLWPAEAEFRAAFVVEVPQGQRRTWIDQLGAFPSDILLLMESRIGSRPITRQQLEEREQLSRAEGVAAYLWGRDDETQSLKFEWSSRAQVLLSLAPRAFAEVLDALPTRELRHWVAYDDGFVEDRDLILDVLRGAQAVFASGSWTGNVSALLALDTSLRHVEKLAEEYRRALEGIPGDRKTEASATVSSFESAEVPAWIESVVEVGLRRADGEDLLLVFASHLVGAASRPGVGVRRWSASPVFLNVLGRRICRSVTAERMKAVMGLAGGRDALTYILVASILGDDWTATWRWYLALLRQRDGTLSAMKEVPASTWVYESISSTLRAQSGPVELWEDAWRELFDGDREHARFDPNDMAALVASQHLIKVGIGVLTSRSQDDKLHHDDAVKMWRVLRQASICLAHEPDRPGRVPHGFDAELFVAARATFGATWPKTLDDDVDWLAADPENRVFTAAALLRAQIPRDDVVLEMTKRGCDPIAAIDAVSHRARRHHTLQAACRIVQGNA